MKQSQYRKLLAALAVIRDAHATEEASDMSPPQVPQTTDKKQRGEMTLTDAVCFLTKVQRNLRKETRYDERNTLLYCVETLQKSLPEGNRAFIYDLCEISEAVTKIALGESRLWRNRWWYARLRKCFRLNWGEAYFREAICGRPERDRDMVLEMKEILKPSKLDRLCAAHPSLRIVLALAVSFILMLPTGLLALWRFGDKAFTDAMGRWMVPLLLGTLAMGTGLCNLFATFFDDDLGSTFTLAFLGGGLGLTLLSLWMGAY